MIIWKGLEHFSTSDLKKYLVENEEKIELQEKPISKASKHWDRVEVF